MNVWTDLLTADELAADYALTASIDPGFAASDRKWWESRTATQLQSLEHAAWNISDGGMYQRARTYRALATAQSL